MSRPINVDQFVEDRAHEEFLRPLIQRIAKEEGVEIVLRVRSARGGHGRAVQEFDLYQTLVNKGVMKTTVPDLIVVGIDGNCTTLAKKRKEIEGVTQPEFVDRLVIACPDPHIECWFLADPNSFHKVVGHQPTVGRKKCARDHYKKLLTKAVRDAGHPATLRGIEFAPELVAAMDLYRASKEDHSLHAFVDELRCKLRLAGAREEKGRGPSSG